LSVKFYRIVGEITKKHFFEPHKFNKLIAAAKEEHAIERIYTELGSRHRAKRHEIKIKTITVEEQEE
jgi:large subunit ribosomal protein LX